MTSYADQQTLWLILTNVVLGLFCLAFVLTVGVAVVQDVVERRREQRRKRGHWRVLKNEETCDAACRPPAAG